MPEMTIQQAFDLALQHHQEGRLNDAESIYRQILKAKPGHADSMHNLGLIAHNLGRNDVAVELIRQVIALQPTNPEAYSNLGEAYRVAGQWTEAVAAQRQAIDLRPAFPTAHYNLGVALYEKGQVDEAISAYRQAIVLKPDDPQTYNNLGTALSEIGRPGEAVTAYRRALALHPSFHVALNNLGSSLIDQGKLDEGIAAYREAIDIKPEFSDSHSNLVFAMNYHPGLEPSIVAEEHRLWNQLYASLLRPVIHSQASDKNPQRCLRVGYLSPDFRVHSVAGFIEGLLEHHDRVQVEAYCYSNVIQPDAVTVRLESLATHWRKIKGLSDSQVAELIHIDGIDILVDLAGHTANNRLLVFARKPAPVQVTWLGYPNTTGLDTIDYRLTDAFADPQGSSEEFYSEQLVRLPRSAWCYRPNGSVSLMDTPPIHEKGCITFGCFNSMPKINEKLLKLWTMILHAVPGSLLILKNNAMNDPHVIQNVRAIFEHQGINQERLELVGRMPDSTDHLAAYGRVDIALDTFPYHGTTTTCEALWMGVPVVTLAGKTHVSRVGVSLLSNLGHPEWIATSPEEYVRIATDLAKDLPHLSSLRNSLRTKMQVSPLIDAAAFARDIESAYREMWRTWCEKQ